MADKFKVITIKVPIVVDGVSVVEDKLSDALNAARDSFPPGSWSIVHVQQSPSSIQYAQYTVWFEDTSA